MHIKRAGRASRVTDSLIDPVLDGLTAEERKAHLVALESDCEDKIRTLKGRIEELEVRRTKAAVEYWARVEIFPDPNLNAMVEVVRKAEAQISAFYAEISDLHSLGLFCKEELGKLIASSSRN